MTITINMVTSTRDSVECNYHKSSNQRNDGNVRRLLASRETLQNITKHIKINAEHLISKQFA